MNIQVTRREARVPGNLSALSALLRMSVRISGAEGAFLVAEAIRGPCVLAHVGLSASELEQAQRVVDEDQITEAAAALGWNVIALPLEGSVTKAWLVLTSDALTPALALGRPAEFPDLLLAMSASLSGMQVAEALHLEDRIAPILNLLINRVGSASSHIAALEILVNALCDSFGGVLCNVWRVGIDGQELRLIASARRGVLDNGDFGDQQVRVVAVRDTDTGDTILSGRQVINRDINAAGVARGPNLVNAANRGMRAQICTPFTWGEDRWAVVLGFDQSGLDLDQVALEILRLGPAMRMILRHRQRDSSMELISRVVEASRDAVLITRVVPGVADLPIVYVNPAFTALTGYQGADVLGRTPSLLQCEETSPAERRRIGEAVRRGQPVQAEVLNRRRDGTRYWVDVRISPVVNTDGECTHFVSVQRDSTAEHEARIAIDLRERAFREVFASNPVPMLIKSPDTRMILDANRAAENLYGYSAEQFRTMSTADLLEPAERARAERFWSRMLKGGNNASGPWRQRTADGRSLRVDASNTVLELHGQPAVLTAIWDRTAQLEAEEAMAQSKEMLRRMADSLLHAQRLAQLGTWSWWPQTGRLECSADLAAMLGHPREALATTDESFLAMIHSQDQPAMANAFAALRRGGAVSDIAFRVVMAGGEEQVLLFSGNVDTDRHIQSCSGFCQDVTQRKRAEAQLLRSEKLRSLGQLTGGIAHDSNNLLTVINANVELALENLPEESPVANLLTNALRAAEAGAKLNSQLLSFAKRQPMHITAVAVQQFLLGFSELARHTLGARCALVLEPEPRPPLNLQADAAHLETAMLNLCLNARDAMPNGGTIRIAHGVVRLPECAAQQRGAAEGLPPPDPEEMAPGHYGCISISDSGIGMTPEVRARIFEPFFTTKVESGGTGLGLSMVVGFAKQSGGGLTVESVPGLGTTFRLYLPIADGASEQMPSRPRQLEPLEGRVLLVDDEPTLRSSTALMLRSLGLSVDEADSADEAMIRLEAPLRYDLLFSDVELGAPTDGIALCNQARAAWPGLPILLSSGFVEEALGADQKTRLQAEFLAKPYHRKSLRAAVAAALLKRNPLHVA